MRLFAVLVAATGACSDPVDRPAPLRLSVDGDSVVRMATVRIEVVVEAQLTGAQGNKGETWETVLQRTLKPNPRGSEDWPWEFQLAPEDSTRYRYSMLATARDGQGAVVARSQAVRDLAEARHTGLRVHFDTACFRRTALCAEGTTCVAGACVDAASDSAQPAADGGSAGPNMTDPVVVEREAPGGVATAGTPCKEGLRACADHGSRTPLHCEGGLWRAGEQCAENDRCDSSDGSSRGQCQAMTSECANRQANVTYCDGETMRVCPDLIRSEVRPCAESERCVPDGDKAQCACRPGYVKDLKSGRCSQADECGETRGGCDPLTECSMSGSQRVCSACPLGYIGEGAQGCTPLMQNLVLRDGVLEPGFSPNTRAYRARLPLLVQRAVLIPSVPEGSKVTLNGAPLEADGSWTSPVLALGDNEIEVAITTAFGVRSSYEVTLERTVSQDAYIKSSNSDTRDHFGFAADVSGDTMVVSAWLDDSNATGVNGDSNNNSASDSGAAYVFERVGGRWKQQAYFKPNDTTPGDYFGSAVRIDGDTIVVGAVREGVLLPDIAATRPGAAYVFTRKAGVWSQTQRLAASRPNGADLFGMSIALDGDTLAIGASWEATGGARSGAVYLFERSGSMWTERQKLKAPMPRADARFSIVALDGDRLVVGSSDDNRGQPLSGSAAVFVRRSGTWSWQQELEPPRIEAETNFGYGVAILGDRILVGAPRAAQYRSTALNPPGDVYVFELEGDRWVRTAALRAPDSLDANAFGTSVALSERGVLVGAPGMPGGSRGAQDARTPDGRPIGAAYLFAKSDQGWKSSAQLQPAGLDVEDGFGTVVTMDEFTIVVTGYLEGSTARGIDAMGTNNGAPNSGAVFVFH